MADPSGDSLGLKISMETLPVSGAQVEGKAVLVPRMDAEEVAARLASRGKIMVPISPPKGVIPYEFKTVISGAFLEFMTRGTITIEGTEALIGDQVVEGTVGKIIGTPQFELAMSIRGVMVDDRKGLS